MMPRNDGRITNSMLDAALSYIAPPLNWRLCKLRPSSKIPVIAEWNSPELAVGDTGTAHTAWRDGKSGIGLVHESSLTGTFDIDSLEWTQFVFAEFGIDLEQLLAGFPRIKGQDGRAKIVFRMPEGALPTIKLVWPKQVENGKPVTVFELRGRGGQDVLPPSVHPDTGLPYSWEVSPFDFADGIPEIPKQLMVIWSDWKSFKQQFESICPWNTQPVVRSKPSVRHVSTQKHNNVIGQFNAAHDMPTMLEAYGYQRLGKRWLSPTSSSGIPGVVIFDDGNVQRCYSHHASDPLADGYAHDCFDLYVTYECNGNIGKAVKEAAQLLGMDSVFEYQPTTVIDIDTLLKNPTTESVSKQPAELPASLKTLPVANLQWLADYISSFSEAPEPAASQLGAIMLGSVLTGRIYKSSNNNYTNLMTGLIASSGRGKQYVQEGIHSVLESCQLSKYVAGSFYTHQSAVYAALSRQPVHICISDEFGDSFMEARKSQNSSKMSVFKAFKRAYSDSSSLFKAETYADNANLAKDKQDKPPIMRPCLSVLGLATPGQFWSEITPQHIEGGLFNRFIVVQVDDFEKPQRSRKTIQDVPDEIIEWIKHVNRVDDIYCHSAANMVPGNQIVVAITEDAMDIFNSFWSEQDARGDALGRSDEYMANMPRRWRENAMRLATILGACADKVITPDLAQWAIDYVRWHGERTITTLMTRVGTENQYSSDMKRVLSFVCANPDGVQTRALLRRFTTMRKRDLDEVLSHLIAAGKVEVIEQDNDKTRKTLIVRAVLS